MSTTTATPEKPVTVQALPRMGQLDFLRLMVQGFRGNFAPLHEAVKKYPQGIETRIVRQRCILMNEPAGIEELLVRNQRCYHRRTRSTPLKVFTGESVLTLSGEPHLRQRKLIQPAFHKSRIDAYADTMATLGEQCAARWRDGDTFDMHERLTALTARIITKTMFSSDIEDDVRIVGEAIDTCLSRSGRYVVPAVGKMLDLLPLRSTRLIKHSLGELDAVIYRFIRDHRRAGGDLDDLLSMLIAARYDDGSALTDRQLRDESMTLFLAGHETTASALSWTLYLLTQHADVAERLRAEVDHVLQGGRSPKLDDMQALDYTRRVFTESMRMFPPVCGVDREAVTPNTVLGMDIRVGDLLIVTPLVTHYDPRWYPEPERFDPDRWLPERAESVPKHAYIPFGGGARRCIGERFAWMEGILLLAIFARDWTFELAPDARIQARLNITLRPSNGVRVIARRRPMKAT